ncbi:hypothetical protein C8R46DRAFT_1109313 [Mycena filopes]|nr:hypothetical protein C8R46DRAFT_1109313 [Mycena filopes]
MFEQSTLKEEDGLIFLVSKSEELTLPSMLPWVPSAGKLSARASEPSGRDSHVSEAPRKGRLHPSSTRHSSVQYSASSVMDLPELEAVSSSSTAPSRYGSGYHDPPLDLPSDGAANLPYKSIEKFRVESHLSMTLPAWDSDFGEPLAVDPPARHPGASIEGVGHSLPAHREARSTRRNKPEMFICEICGNTFTARHNLKNHINSHNSVKVFKCEDCGQSFGTAAVLNRHKRNCRGSREESEYRRRQTELRRLGF